MLRIGANKNVVDNWAKGGLLVSIREDGMLGKHGYYKPGYGTRATSHPDTGVVFESFHVPFFREAVALASRFHALLGGIHSIGWDMAISESGPLFIEGNDNWEISMPQACEGGLKEKFNELFQ